MLQFELIDISFMRYVVLTPVSQSHSVIDAHYPMQTTYGPLPGSGWGVTDSESDSATSAAESANSMGPTSDLAHLSVKVNERILAFLPGNDIVFYKR